MRFAAIVALAVATSAVNLNALKKGTGLPRKPAADTEEPDNTDDAKPTPGYQAKDATTDRMYADLAAADQDDD